MKAREYPLKLYFFSKTDSIYLDPEFFMRRVRSQLDNLAAQSASSNSGHPQVQQPIGGNHQTYAIQRQLEGMGIFPNMMPHPQALPQYSYPAYQPAGMPFNANPATQSAQAPAIGNAELENIKGSLDRLTGKLQGIVQAQSAAPQRPSTDYNPQFDRLYKELGLLHDAVNSLAANPGGETNLDGLHQVIDANYSSLCEPGWSAPGDRSTCE